MTDAQRLMVELGVTGVDEATAKFETLANAIDRASKALADLAGRSHGTIAINMVGDVANITIEPSAGNDGPKG